MFFSRLWNSNVQPSQDSMGSQFNIAQSSVRALDSTTILAYIGEERAYQQFVSGRYNGFNIWNMPSEELQAVKDKLLHQVYTDKVARAFAHKRKLDYISWIGFYGLLGNTLSGGLGMADTLNASQKENLFYAQMFLSSVCVYLIKSFSTEPHQKAANALHALHNFLESEFERLEEAEDLPVKRELNHMNFYRLANEDASENTVFAAITMARRMQGYAETPSTLQARLEVFQRQSQPTANTPLMADDSTEYESGPLRTIERLAQMLACPIVVISELTFPSTNTHHTILNEQISDNYLVLYTKDLKGFSAMTVPFASGELSDFVFVDTEAPCLLDLIQLKEQLQALERNLPIVAEVVHVQAIDLV